MAHESRSGWMEKFHHHSTKNAQLVYYLLFDGVESGRLLLV